MAINSTNINKMNNYLSS